MIITIDELLNMNLKDEVFIIETDTVYGLGCLYNSEIGAERISQIKNRPGDKHYSLLVSNMSQVEKLATDYTDSIDLLNKYWPGAITFIFKKSSNVPSFVSGDDTIGLRMPNNSKTLKALDKFGPMIMTSLNKSGEPSIIKYSDALKFEGCVDFIVKGNDLFDQPSTVYDIKSKKVLRQGGVRIK